MNAARVVAGTAGSNGVRWLLTGAGPRRRLAGELEAMLEHGWTVIGCDLYRAKLKPRRKLSGWYVVRLRGPARRVHARHFAATWLADPPATGAEIAASEREARERGLAAPFRTLHRWAPDVDLQIQVSPLDGRLSALPAVTDPDWAAQVLDASRVCVETVRYRPGERHVIRYRAAGRVYYAKLYRDPLPRGTGARLAGMEEWLARFEVGVCTPRTVAVLPAERVVIQAAAPGVPMAYGSIGLRAAGTALASFQRAPGRLLAGPERPLASELAAVARAAEHLDVLLPDAARSLHATLSRAGELGPQLPAEPRVSLHGDCKLDHFVTAGGAVGLIDLDRCRPGPASSDLGKLLADLIWQEMATGRPVAERAAAALMEGHAAAGGRADPARVRLFEALFSLKAAARRVPLWRPDWGEGAWQLVGAAERALEIAAADGEPAVVAG